MSVGRACHPRTFKPIYLLIKPKRQHIYVGVEDESVFYFASSIGTLEEFFSLELGIVEIVQRILSFSQI
nr:MAG TPA: hypothetical protein [Caudoviricetes sp.]